MTLLPCVEVGAENAEFAIIWLHGLGADGHDFEGIVPELKLNLAIRYIFPHAPAMPVTINNGLVMPAWYDIKSSQIDQREDEAGIRRSEKALIALVENEIQRGIPSENIILAGFSQGGAIALHTGLRYHKPLAGIMALSTYMPLTDTLDNEIHPANREIPILLTHGLYDTVIPIELAQQTNTTLQQFEYSPEFQTYPMEHSICPEEINDIKRWISARFK
jgi:phospholipase/carboxylesterase